MKFLLTHLPTDEDIAGFVGLVGIFVVVFVLGCA